MRRTLWSTVFLLTAGFAVCCTWWGDLSLVGLEPSETATEQHAHLKADAAEAAQAMRCLVSAQRAELVDKLKKEVAELQAGIDRLAAETDRLRGAARAVTRAAIEAMRRTWDLSMKRLEAAESAAWPLGDEAKTGARQPAPRCGRRSKNSACG